MGMRGRGVVGAGVVAVLAVGCARPGPATTTPGPVAAPVAVAAAPAEPVRPVAAAPTEAELQEALARDVRDARAHEALARMYYERSLSQSSYAILARQVVAQGLAVLERDGRTSASLLTTRGLLELADGRPDRALQDFAAAVAIDPGDLRAQEALGGVAMKVRDYARARAAYAAIVAARGDDDLAAMAALGAAEVGLGDFDAAEAAFRRAAARAPGDPWAHYRLALALRLRLVRDGGNEEAFDREIRKAWELAGEDPRYAEVRRLAEERGATYVFACIYPIGTYYGTQEGYEAWRAWILATEAAKVERRRSGQTEEEDRKRLLELERQAIEAEAAARGAAVK